jgi:hypothetical protein
MNCGKIVGIGERFSDNNELKYELTLFLSDGRKVTIFRATVNRRSKVELVLSYGSQFSEFIFYF